MQKLYQEIFEISKLKKKITTKVLPCVPHLLYFREIRNYYVNDKAGNIQKQDATIQGRWHQNDSIRSMHQDERLSLADQKVPANWVSV